MAHRLETYVVRGEISNSCTNSVTGRLEVVRAHTSNGRTTMRPAVLLLSLTGNLSAGLAGRHFRFAPRLPGQTAAPPLPDFFHPEQIGAIADSLLRIVAAPADGEDSPDDAVSVVHPEEHRHRVSVYLEWYSQNGTVALELLDPVFEFVPTAGSLGCQSSAGDADGSDSDTVAAAQLPPTTFPLLTADDTCFEIIPDPHIDPSDFADESSDEASDDQFQLFLPGLEEQIRRSAAESTESNSCSPPFHSFEAEHRDESATVQRPRRKWDEVIPGIDSDTKRLYETWDEVLGGEKDEPLTWLFDEPLRLPTPDSLHDEAHAWQVLTQLLRAMALRGVAFDMCPHVSALDAYRLLIEELLPEAGVHPGLVDTGFICHFDTAEFCPECRADLDNLA